MLGDHIQPRQSIWDRMVEGEITFQDYLVEAITEMDLLGYTQDEMTEWMRQEINRFYGRDDLTHES